MQQDEALTWAQDVGREPNDIALHPSGRRFALVDRVVVEVRHTAEYEAVVERVWLEAGGLPKGTKGPSSTSTGSWAGCRTRSRRRRRLPR